MTPAILDHLWQSTLVALLVVPLAAVMQKASASVRYGLWLAASVKFLIPFAALAALGRLLVPALKQFGGLPLVRAAPEAAFIQKAARPFSDLMAAQPVSAAPGPAQSLLAGAPMAEPAPSIQAVLPHVDPALMLLAVWALGFAALAIRWVLRWARLRRVVRSATPVAWSAPMPVLAAPSLVEPGLVGFMRPVLVVPQTLPEHLSQVEIAAIVAHEAAHLRRRDNLTAALHMLVEALFWFHPLVWWIGGRLIAERERACDEAVVKAGHDRSVYARSLIESCKLYLQSPLDCVAGASGSNLKSRVETIMTAPLTSPLSLSKKALLAAAGAFAFATPVAAGMLATPAGQQAVARATAMAASLSPARGPAAPSPADQAALPQDDGAAKPVVLARNDALLAPAPAVTRTDAAPIPLTLDEATRLAALAPVAAAPSAAQPVAQPLAPLPAGDARSQAEAFVKTYAAQVGSRQVTGRWRSPICVEVVGLTPEQTASVKARVEEVAAGAGVPIASAPVRVTGSRIDAGSGKGCQVYNVEIGFTDNPQAMLDKVMARKTRALGDATSATRNAKTVTLPIQAWYLTNSAMAQNDTGGLKVSVVWQRGDPNAGGGSSYGEGYVGGAYIPPGSSSNGLGGGGSNFGSSDFGFPGGGAWNAGPDLHRGFANVFVIVDLRRAGTKNLGLIADYVSMLALSEPAALGNCQALPSVTDLFASCPGRPAPDGLTAADAAYLTALYDENRAAGTDDVAKRMADILGKARLASR